jgi:para-aminobenzoate synthetase component 1
MIQFPIIYLNSNDGTGLLAFGEGETIILKKNDKLQKLQEFIDQQKGNYLFGYLSYDLKEQLHGLKSENNDSLLFPETYFWKPKYVVNLHKESVEFLQGEKNSESLNFISQFLEEETDQNFHPHNFEFKARISKEEYIAKIVKIKEQIQLGNIYELNFCQEYFAENVDIPYEIDTYFKLNTITQAPYSSYFKFGDFDIFCGSPERFLKKEGNKLISQPIKGTAPRGGTIEEDAQIKKTLSEDPKERAENIMIVDLVRNDLSRVAAVNSVRVDELCEIYSFETVHQMISSISCDLKEGVNFTEILKATFPMGSMTGAPKLRAMELIEELESFKRGLYSGSIGYITPSGDFDFNVVIRTLLYNQKESYLSCSVGGAITIQSDPEKEYQECLVKVKRIMDGINE